LRSPYATRANRPSGEATDRDGAEASPSLVRGIVAGEDPPPVDTCQQDEAEEHRELEQTHRHEARGFEELGGRHR
jgi:hypothetical protein